MKKFFLILKKEIKELLTIQMILPFVIIVLMFTFIGNILNNETKKSEKDPIKITIMDLDNTSLSKNLIELLRSSNYDVNLTANLSQEEFNNYLITEKISSAMIFPKGMEESVNLKKLQIIPSYIQLFNISMLSMKNISATTNALGIINSTVSNQIISSNITNTDVNWVKNPFNANDYVIVAGKTANVNATTVINFMTSQTVLIPIVLFLVIVLAAQMVAVAVATEKENKTLEILLSSPVSRQIIVSAKMAAAGLVALIMAGIYLYGMSKYIKGISGQSLTTSLGGSIDTSIQNLGIVFNSTDYVLLGLSLFLGILSALAIAMILGVFAEDAKAAQAVIAPLMVIILIPYLLTSFLDISSLPAIYKYLIYAIPFSHTFLAAPNLIMGNYMFVVWGIVYQFIIFIIFVYIAAKIFSTDRIFTLRLNFGRKK